MSHALGGSDKGRPTGTLGDLNAFSFHPVKHMTTGEGGMITTHDDDWAKRMREFRNHGITSDHRQRSQMGDFFYEMVDLGYNYRLSDIHCALGISQLEKLHKFVQRRQEIAAIYDDALSEIPYVHPLGKRPYVSHAYHLYMVQFDLKSLGMDRAAIFSALRAENIGVHVHYIPVHLHPFYRNRFKTGRGLCPVAESSYERLISLPIFPNMDESDVEDVIHAIKKLAGNQVS